MYCVKDAPGARRRGSSYRRLRVIDLVDQSAEAHTVAQQDKLILVFSALLARTGQELDCLRPFGMRKLGFAREHMEVRNERSDQLEGARIFAEALVQFLDATECQ